MDMGLIGGLAVAYALHEGCKQTCELGPQALVFMFLIVLLAAVGAWYVIKHSGGGTADSKNTPLSSVKPSQKVG